MIEEPKAPRIEDDELIIETQNSTERYDARYLVCAVLVYVAKGDGSISDQETERMMQLVNEHFGLQSAQSLEILTNAVEDIAANPDFGSLLRDLSGLIDESEKEDVALMMLKVAAADGRKNAEEMETLSSAADLVAISAETMHRAFDRYFAETMT